MTPKQMAINMVKEFTFNCQECDNAILSAFIAVDYILETNPRHTVNIIGKKIDYCAKDFYLEVKQELNKL